MCRVHVYKITRGHVIFPGICATTCYVCTVSQRKWMSLILLQNDIHRIGEVSLKLSGRDQCDLNQQGKLQKWCGRGMPFIFYLATWLLREVGEAAKLRRMPPTNIVRLSLRKRKVSKESPWKDGLLCVF